MEQSEALIWSFNSFDIFLAIFVFVCGGELEVKETKHSGTTPRVDRRRIVLILLPNAGGDDRGVHIRAGQLDRTSTSRQWLRRRL